MRHDAILILDFGGQYCHLIARRVREQAVYSEVHPCDIDPREIEVLSRRLNVKGVILSGGPHSVYGEDAPKFNPDILDLELPFLGLCYGHQLIAHLFGGRVAPGGRREYGVAQVHIDRPVGVLKDLGSMERVWMSHGDAVQKVPQGFEVLAHTENDPAAAIKHGRKPIYGLQWHPEVAHTENGSKMLGNFIFEVCGCRKTWIMEDFIEGALREIGDSVGDTKAIIALSGGIDSGTAAALASRAIGRRVTAVFVDHGFMRMGEPESVREAFEGLNLNLVVVEARERFLERLRGITDPEEKRRIIGEEFIRVFEEVAREVGADYLIQGTIYPDRIESGYRRYSDKIKTHHNVAGLPSQIDFRGIVEPLRDLYKDEVREVAKKLGLSKEIVSRQPFPGPGLAVRVAGEVTKEKVDVLRKAHRIVEEEVEKRGLNKDLWQYFAVLTDTRSTGVKGDARVYGYTVAVRAVESREAMTASFARIPYDVLERISTRITNEVPQVTRVVYDVTHKPPGTIEWE
ncbi:MAG: glutamine-hydrolyzing GMP synthase [Candidatus Geothermarchaeales archaeon]